MADDQNQNLAPEAEGITPEPEGVDLSSVPEPMQKYIKELRAEARGRRLKLKEAEVEVSVLKGKLDEVDKKVMEEQGNYKALYESEKQKHDETVQAFKARIVRESIKTEALAKGIIDSELSELINISDVTIDDDGRVSGISEAVDAYKAAKPHLFGVKAPQSVVAPGATVSPAAGVATPTATVSTTPGDVRKLSKEEYARVKRNELDKLRRSNSR